VTARHRWLLVAGAVAAAQMIVVVLVDGGTRPGYDPYRNWVSQLALGPRGWLGFANLAACAVWLIIFAAGLHLHLRPSRASRWAVRLVVLCGAGFAVLAAVPIDAGLEYPPGAPAVHTAVGYAHQAAALATFASGTAAAVLLGHCIRHAYDRAARLGTLVAAVMVVSFVASCVLVTLDVLGIHPGTPSGLLERVALFTGLGWLAVAGLCLLRAPSRGMRDGVGDAVGQAVH
jgi:hypothetical protein